MKILKMLFLFLFLCAPCYALDGDVDDDGKIDSTFLPNEAAILTGRAGGQTLIGGTGIADVLSLQGTSGNGTATSPAINLKVGNNGGTTALSLLNNGNANFAKHIISTRVARPSVALTPVDSGEVGNLNGTYYYSYTYYTADGETEGCSPVGPVGVAVVNKKMNLSGITVSPNPLVVGRKIYRTSAAALDAAEMQYLATIPDNTTTTYQDNIADGSLGSAEKFINTTGGEIFSNTTKIFSSGSAGSLSLGYGNGEMAYADVAIGPFSMSNLTYGYRNTAVGLYSQYLLTTGARNASLGTHTLNDNLVGSDNAAFGYGALHFNLASQNSALGCAAAQQNISGTDNTAVGFYAMERNTSGVSNTAVGKYALLENLGDKNTAVGMTALQKQANGTGNTALGWQSGMYTTGGAFVTTSTGGTFLGYDARPSADSTSYETVIGATARGSGPYTATIGPTINYSTTLWGNLGVRTGTPTANCQIVQQTTDRGTVSVSAGGTTWTGSNTKFLNTFKVGDSITSEGQTLTILTIPSDTSLTTAAVGAAIVGKAYTLTGGTRFSVYGNGRVVIGGGTQTAMLNLPAGTATAGTAPLKFTSGPLLGTPEAGALEFLTDSLYFTPTTGATRRKIALEGTLDFSFTTEANITSPITAMTLLLTGDDDSENDTIDLQDGTVPGQVLYIIAAAAIDADDTCTISFADTTATNAPTVAFDKVGESATLVWTGTMWVVTSLQTSL